MNKTLKLTISLSTSILLALLAMGCGTGEKQDNPSALLFLLGQRGSFTEENQRKCVVVYNIANSCVGGNQFFNPGVGCVSPNLKDEATYAALITCVTKAVSDPVQPCNMPQFKYGLASQALAGAFASCNAKYTSGTTEYDLSGTLKY